MAFLQTHAYWNRTASQNLRLFITVTSGFGCILLPTMEDWEVRFISFIKAADRDILCDASKVIAEIARQHAETEFEKYRIVQDRLFKSDFYRFVELEVTTKKQLGRKRRN